MLRKSTALSEDMKRVGVSRSIVCDSGAVKWRCVAMARLSVALSGLDPSGEVVGVGGWFEAMARRRLARGSWEVDNSIVQKIWCVSFNTHNCTTLALNLDLHFMPRL